MQKKFLREGVGKIIGKTYEKLVDLLLNKKHVNEFLLAKKLDITINQTRNLLYRLQDYGMVSAIRKKDKRKGWYTYFWKLEELKVLEFLKNEYLKRIEQTSNQIENRETRDFYICNTCNIEFNESNALDYNYTCPECGQALEIKDNTELLKQLNRNLSRYKEILADLEKEISKLKEKIQKRKDKELAKTLKKKSLKKTVKKKIKKKVKKKVVKKISKKKVKKLPKKESLKRKASKKSVKKTTSKTAKKISKKKDKKKVVKKISKKKVKKIPSKKKIKKK